MDYNIILQNLACTGIGAIIFVTAYLANMLFGLYYNLKILGEEFSWDRIKNSAIKVACVCGGCILLTVCITVLPQFATMVGWTIPEEFVEVFQALAIIGIFLYSACKYVIEALGKLRDIVSARIEQ